MATTPAPTALTIIVVMIFIVALAVVRAVPKDPAFVAYDPELARRAVLHAIAVIPTTFVAIFTARAFEPGDLVLGHRSRPRPHVHNPQSAAIFVQSAEFGEFLAF